MDVSHFARGCVDDGKKRVQRGEKVQKVAGGALVNLIIRWGHGDEGMQEKESGKQETESEKQRWRHTIFGGRHCSNTRRPSQGTLSSLSRFP